MYTKCSVVYDLTCSWSSPRMNTQCASPMLLPCKTEGLQRGCSGFYGPCIPLASPPQDYQNTCMRMYAGEGGAGACVHVQMHVLLLLLLLLLYYYYCCYYYYYYYCYYYYYFYYYYCCCCCCCCCYCYYYYCYTYSTTLLL